MYRSLLFLVPVLLLAGHMPLVARTAPTFVIAGDKEKDKDQEKELKKMQGSWKVVLSQVDGKTMPVEAFRKVLVVIKDDRIVFKDNGKTYEEVELTLDPKAKPREMNYKYVSGLKKGVRELGIYVLDGEQLTICMAQATQKRPTELVSKKGMGDQLVKLKRVSP